MGCWNATCGITQLPILAGEKIRVFILAPHHGTNKFVTNPNSFVYSTDMFEPMGIPFVAGYNDYGSVENITNDYNTDILYDILKKSAILPKDKPFSVDDEVQYIIEPVKTGRTYLEILAIKNDVATVREKHRGRDAKQFDVPISELRHDNCEDYYDDFGDLNKIIDLIQRNVFEINNKTWAPFGMNATAIPGLFYVRENVWQALIADIEEESEYSWVPKPRKKLQEDIDAFIAELKKELKENDKEEDSTERAMDFAMMLSMRIERMGGEGNTIGRMFCSSREGFNALPYRDTIVDAVRNNNDAFAKEILTDAADTARFIGVMGQLRKSLIPQCGAGSQCTGEDYHEALINVTTTELKSIKTHWDEEEE